jgi:hypothetical protein
MKPVSHSIQRLEISVGPYNISRLAKDRSVGRVDSERLGYLRNFSSLSTLRAPIDVLLGPSTNVQSLSLAWCRNLPPSLEVLFLDLGFLRSDYSLTLWYSNQLFLCLAAGASELPKICPKLQKIVVGCLYREDCDDFRKVATGRMKGLEVIFDDAAEKDDPHII